MIKLLIGIYISSYSLMFWIIHLNKLVIGVSISKYLIYCFTHLETLLLFMGLFLIINHLKNKH